jgi:protoheme IX farnesyltransferase
MAGGGAVTAPGASAVAPPPGEAPATAGRPSASADWRELFKVRLNAMVVVSAAAGAWLARGEPGARQDGLAVLHACGGTALVAAGVGALNQVLERGTDARMERTRRRPVPSGRMSPTAASWAGGLLVLAGLAWLAAATNLLAAGLAAATALLYLGVYTPLKSRSSINTLVGAIPGALPPVIGWAAVAGGAGPGAWLLFALLFLWQIPHFLAIAWLYREDYRRGGLVMITVEDPTGGAAGRQAVLHALALLAALLLGLGYAAAAAGFARARDDASARGLLWASLAYLPLLLGLMVVESPVP